MRNAPHRAIGALAIILAVLGAWLGAAPASAITLGRQLVVTSTIQAAVDSALPGDTILVPPGTYRETVNVTTPGLTIAGPTNAVLDGSGLGARIGIRVRSTDGTRIDGFTLKGMTVRGYDFTGVQLSGVDNFRLTGTSYVDNPLYGPFPVRCSRGRIDHNQVTGSVDSGIYVGQCDDVMIDHDVAHGNTVGIEVELSTRVVVEDNVATGNSVGFFVQISPGRAVKVTRDVVLRDNVAAGNNLPNLADGFIGLLPSGVGILNAAGDDVRVEGNVAAGNHSAGIAIISLPADIAALDPALDPTPTGGVVRGNVTHGNGRSPGPELAPLQGADIVWDGTGTTCFVVGRGVRSFPATLPRCADRMAS